MFISITIFAQTNFDKGFKAGYSEGYCYDKGIGCIPPLSPLPPLVKIEENSNSYQDGYNRGFQKGLEEQKSKENLNQSNTDRQRYQTYQPRFDTDFIYQPNYELMQKVLEKKQQDYAQAEQLYYEFSKYIYTYNSSLSKDILDKYRDNFMSYSDNYIKRNKPQTYSDYKKLINQLVKDFQEGVLLTEEREAKNSEIENSNKMNSQKLNNKMKEEDLPKPYYKGLVDVYTNAELYDVPDMINGKMIYSVQSGKVKILERVKEGKYYKVNANGHIGYIGLISIKE
ncbi:hypothetical protein CMT95_17145 [Elizabethkingia anophelis]|nr:hypothetical protein [Elizabethkingia anophelis]RBA30855.1 hypothetical protein DSC50_17120 [Elizabethkingia anophelis]